MTHLDTLIDFLAAAAGLAMFLFAIAATALLAIFISTYWLFHLICWVVWS